MSLPARLRSFGISKALDYLERDPDANLPKLMDWLDIKLGMEQPSVPFIRGVVNMRNYKTAEELVEIERACNVTADMHITAMKVLRKGMKEWEVVAA